MAVIPYIKNQQDGSRSNRILILTVVVIVSFVVTVAALTHIFYEPLDSLWYYFSDKISDKIKLAGQLGVK